MQGKNPENPADLISRQALLETLLEKLNGARICGGDQIAAHCFYPEEQRRNHEKSVLSVVRL